MKTKYNSLQNKVTKEHLLSAYDHLNLNVSDFQLYDIAIRGTGRGHYQVTFEFDIDGEEIEFNVTTTNSVLIDNWKDFQEDQDNRSVDVDDEVIESMLGLASKELSEKVKELESNIRKQLKS